MPNREEVAYFGAGPASLPTTVLEESAANLLNFEDYGRGISEISHRSATATNIINSAKANIVKLLDIPDDYEVLFMQGGGSGQFSAVVYNLVSVWAERRRRKLEGEIKSGDGEQTDEQIKEQVLQRLKKEVSEDLKMDYLVTGSWSLKASQEAASLIAPENVNVAVDARGSDKMFKTIPAEETWKLTPTKREGGKGSAFVYYCDNETVDGVEFPNFPKVLEPQSNNEEDERIVVADMSSNFLSRKIDVKKFGVIFAGAQKNVGMAGITIIILRKSLLPPSTSKPPTDLLRSLNLPRTPVTYDYATIAKNNSLYNTLPIFPVRIAELVMRDLLVEFGDKKILGQQEVANKKAKLLYDELDKWPKVYTVVPEKSVRSRMNVCFRVGGGDAETEKKWLAEAEKKGLLALKGHRSVGGIRASNYNAVSQEAVEKLVKYLAEYAQGQ
ncbi:MAG: Phosphoserine transaminase [Candelina mexicana]|nr:MAG: Phosphoserine transaminase [Candelina mexicana]